MLLAVPRGVLGKSYQNACLQVVDLTLSTQEIFHHFLDMHTPDPDSSCPLEFLPASQLINSRAQPLCVHGLGLRAMSSKSGTSAIITVSRHEPHDCFKIWTLCSSPTPATSRALFHGRRRTVPLRTWPSCLSITTVQRGSRLPQTNSSHVFIWSLVLDIEKLIEPQALLVVRLCLLVRQPLDPIRYKT